MIDFKTMKKIISVLIITVTSILCVAQTSDKKWGLGLAFGTFQYSGDYGSEFFKYKSSHPAGMLSISRYMNAFWDLEGNVSAGLLDYTWTNSNGLNESFEGRLTNFDFLLKYKFNNGKLLKENARIAPYLFIGLGDGIYKNKLFFEKGSNVTFNFPAGGGIKLKLAERLALDLRLNYHYTLTELYDGLAPITNSLNDQFLTSTIGLIYHFDKKDTDKDGVGDRIDICSNTPNNVVVDYKGCPKDNDNDKIPDYLDKCADIAGVATAQGCPDEDGDTISDAEDMCPKIAGLRSLNGCPDEDKDGIQDDKDECPSIAGILDMNGCPDADGDKITDAKDKCPSIKGSDKLEGCPDQDNDNVPDSEDACPVVAGIVSNKGCPEVSEENKKVFDEALKGVQFESGKDVIKKSSFGVLNKVVNVMKANSNYKLDINGHTDNQGNDAKNLTLSQKRAEAVKAYLVKNGVNENALKATGFGETQPIDNNETAVGRAKNRRVEFKVNF